MKSPEEEAFDLSIADKDRVLDQKTFIDDLPPEMLAKILKNVSTRALYKCRLLSRQWNETSSVILCTRRDNELKFTFNNGKFSSGGFWPPGKKSLEDFVDCAKESGFKNCPFARFSFDFSKPSQFFDHEDWTSFLSDFDVSGVKCLNLNAWEIEDFESKLRLTAETRNLKLKKMPQLEEFGFRGDSQVDLTAEQVELFSSVREEEKEKKEAEKILIQLPQMKILTFHTCADLNRSMFFNFRKILQDLLNAAINLTRIELKLEEINYTPQQFQFLLALGNFEGLRKSKIDFCLEIFYFLRAVKDKSVCDSNIYAVKTLRLETEWLCRESSGWADATNFLSHLFESSKNTLEKMEMGPLGFLSSLSLPTFTNLEEIRLSRSWDGHAVAPFFPPGVNSRDIFPAVRTLRWNCSFGDWTGFFPGPDFIPRFPNVDTFWMADATEYGISVVALMCPNLKNLKVELKCQRGFLKVGRSIWTWMKQLESLHFNHIRLDLPENNSHALDSCFSGIPIQNCQRLFEMTKSENERLKTGKSHVQIPESQLKLLTERKHPSILDLKDLKKLTMNSFSGGKQWTRKTFRDKLTWIGEMYAFALRPDLKTT